MLLARLPNDLSNLRFLHFLHLLIWLILCTTECSMNWMGNDLVKQVTLHLLLEKTRDDPTVFLCQFKVQANTEHDKQNNDSMSFFQTTLPHCQRAVSAALTKHSMSRWAASPMAITGAAPDAIRCEWCNNSGCVCNGEMSLIWHIDMMWCHPDVILMSWLTEITQTHCSLSLPSAKCAWRPCVSCKPNLPAEKPARFIFSKCIQNRQECYGMIPWIAILKIHDDFMLSSYSSYFIFQNQWE